MMAWATQDGAAACEPIKDLKLAASFVKSIETDNHRVNLDIQKLALEIESLIEKLDSGDASGDARPAA